MLRNGHVRFGGRPAETHQFKDWQGAAGRPYTYCRTFAGWVYAAFVVDVFSRRIVGWQLSKSLRTDLALDALEMGIWTRQRQGRDLADLTHHSDKGVQYLAVRYTQRLAEAGAAASVGSTGDSYDCQSVSTGFRKNRVVPAGAL